MRERYLFEMIIPGSERQLRCSYAPAITEVFKPQTLASLAEETKSCNRCLLRKDALQVVFGEGNPQAKLMLVGEGPGAQEDKQGRPFVGNAGELLNKILDAAEISREEIYIANVIKCRPPENRTPQRDEVDACFAHLQKQIKLIQPEIIVALGAVATQALLGAGARISTVRGQWHEMEGIRVMPTYHPADLLQDPAKKRPVWQDIQAVRDAYRQLK